MNAIEMKCNAVGTIEIVRAITHEPNRIDDSGAYATYQAISADNLHEIAANYSNVVRPNGKVLKGAIYTERMAQNDFAALV